MMQNITTNYELKNAIWAKRLNNIPAGSTVIMHGFMHNGFGDFAKLEYNDEIYYIDLLELLGTEEK